MANEQENWLIKAADELSSPAPTEVTAAEALESAELTSATAPDASQLDDVGALGVIDTEVEDATRTETETEDEAPTFLSEMPESFADATEAPESAELSSSSTTAIVLRGDRSEQTKPADTVMLVNDVADDECRIALVRKGRLESFFGERAATATNVGNIYKGRVTNVEPAIQAAFIDFGESQNGFLHVSDLHPRYFPGEDRTESVGRKIPRRDRPPIQQALRRGQEILVQVIKEGLGTKGPTLTSYLSIPGRLLVMMPEMDNVGVSRKVDDEDQRRAMRKILDSLELPEGFGFILRTAGFDRSRTELQRDATYLMRLWQAMERRMERTGAPCELYTESDLLVRTIRDVVDDSVKTIVVDSASAHDRASLFLEVAFPKDPPEIRFYDGGSPIFHAFGIEPQVRSIYSREVPLVSGGALVFDQTEAMVAIDVNSGKSRSARDSETNAYNTNKEAADEICRQLRLRDLGGLVICDLIDMRAAKHRREIEERFRENMKRDRAKTTVLPVSDFGMIELTRQRMRPSVQKMHFMACPHCNGLGDVKIPDSTAAEALRDVQSLLDSDRVHRVEMVCSVKVASVLLSGKRDRLYGMERRSGKRIDVRISEALPMDRVDLYGYDERGADVELGRLALPKPPALDSLPTSPPDEPAEFEVADESAESGGGRRRRRRRRSAPADAASIALAGGFDDLPDIRDDEPSALDEIRANERAKAAERTERAAQASRERDERMLREQSRRDDGETEEDGATESAGSEANNGGSEDPRRKRRRRRRGRGGAGGAADGASASPTGNRTSSSTSRPPQARSAPAPRQAPPPPPPVDAQRVHLLAKEFGISSKDLLTALRERESKELPLEAKSHMSMLAPAWVSIAHRIYGPEVPEAPNDSGDEASEGSTSGDEGAHPIGPDGEPRPKRRRRRGRRGRGGGSGGANGGGGGNGGGPGGAPGAQSASAAPRADGPRNAASGRGDAPSPTDDPGDGQGKRKRRRRRRGRGGRGGAGEGAESGGGQRAASSTAASAPPPPSASPPASATPAKTPPRGLYGRAVRKLGGRVAYDDR